MNIDDVREFIQEKIQDDQVVLLKNQSSRFEVEYSVAAQKYKKTQITK